MCIFLGNPVGCLVANVLAPVIVNHDSDIPFMVCSWLQSVLSQVAVQLVYCSVLNSRSL